MASDIVERLRGDLMTPYQATLLMDEAAAEIERLKKEALFTAITVLPDKDAEIERLRAALEPFAKAANCYDDGVRGSNMPRTGVWYGWKMGKGIEAELTVENLRDARAALAQEKKDG